MPALKHKVLAYVTRGNHLLVFSHPHFPDAGIQVHAGTLRDGETPEAGVIREAIEETGLTGLALVAFLGEYRRDMSDFGLDEIHHRHIYHLRCDGDPPERWNHFERDPSGGDSEPILFEFFWATMPNEIPELAAGHGDMLPALFRSVSRM